MRRLLMMVPIAALAVTGFVPAQAADPPEKTPIVVACAGTGGYGGWAAADEWAARSRVEGVSTPCVVWSPDTAELPGEPPSVEPIPNDPFDYYWRVEKWLGQTNPVGVGGRMGLRASGDFACGEGTLTGVDDQGKELEYGNQGLVFGNYWSWDLDWTATFENGVGELEGTAERVRFAHSEVEETRSVTGRILVNDGAAYDQCDDSADSSQVVAVFVLE